MRVFSRTYVVYLMDDDIKKRIATAVLKHDVEELTKIAKELEQYDDCEHKLLRAEVLTLLFGYRYEKPGAKEYLNKAIELLRSCKSSEHFKRFASRIYSIAMVYAGEEIADYVLEDLTDERFAPLRAMAYKYKGDQRKAMEELKKALKFKSRHTANIALILTSLIPLNQRDEATLAEIAWEAFRYGEYMNFNVFYARILDYLYEKEIYGDTKAKVYALLARETGDKALAVAAAKAAKDKLVRSFANVVLAELTMSENPEMSMKYAAKVEHDGTPRGDYLMAISNYLLSRKDFTRIFYALDYALRAYYNGLMDNMLSSRIVEPVLSSIVRTLTLIAYRLNDDKIAKALENACEFAPTFRDYKHVMYKACACIYKMLKKEENPFLELAREYEDTLLDECLGE